MSGPPAGRLHLWFWVAVGVLLYIASGPPVEAWHDKWVGRNTHSLSVSTPSKAVDLQDAVGPSSAKAASKSGHQSASEDGFQIVELHYDEPPPRPRWMEILYAPIHWLEGFQPFESIFHRYRQWCDAVM